MELNSDLGSTSSSVQARRSGSVPLLASQGVADTTPGPLHVTELNPVEAPEPAADGAQTRVVYIRQRPEQVRVRKDWVDRARDCDFVATRLVLLAMCIGLLYGCAVIREQILKFERKVSHLPAEVEDKIGSLVSDIKGSIFRRLEEVSPDVGFGTQRATVRELTVETERRERQAWRRQQTNAVSTWRLLPGGGLTVCTEYAQAGGHASQKKKERSLKA